MVTIRNVLPETYEYASFFPLIMDQTKRETKPKVTAPFTQNRDISQANRDTTQAKQVAIDTR